MENQAFNLFTIDDQSTELQSKGTNSFGLNTGYVKLMQFVEDAGKDKTPGNAIDIHVGTEESNPVRLRLYVDKRPLYNRKNELVAVDGEGYMELYMEDIKQKFAVIKQTVKSLGVTDAQIAGVGNMNDIVGSIKRVVGLIPANYNKILVDFFLEYQWSIGKDQDRTYLTFPNNMKGGIIIIPHVKSVGKFKQIFSEEDGLCYKDDAGNVHPFKRSTSFLTSKKGYPQGPDVVLPVWMKEQETSSFGSPTGSAASDTEW